MHPDVVTLPTTEIIKLKRMGLLAHYESAEAAAYPPELRASHFTAYCLKPYGLAYNRRRVEPNVVPRRYSELADSKWAGRIIHLDPFSNDSVLLWVTRMYNIIGPLLLGKIFKQALSTVKDFDEAVKRVASGEADGAFPTRLDKPKFGDDSVGLGLVPPVFVETESVAVMANASSPNSARLFLNFILSEEGQKTLSGQIRIPARPRVLNQIPLHELDPVFDFEEFDSDYWRKKASEVYM